MYYRSRVEHKARKIALPQGLWHLMLCYQLTKQVILICWVLVQTGNVNDFET